MISEHTLAKVWPVNLVATYKSRKWNSWQETKSEVYRNGKHMISTCSFVVVLFYIRSLRHWGLHTPQRRTEETDFFYPKGSWQKIISDFRIKLLFKSLPSPRCPLVRSVGWSWATPTEKERKRFQTGGKVEPTALTPVQNQPFLPEGKGLCPFGLKPGVILYRNTTINIYKYI